MVSAMYKLTLEMRQMHMLALKAQHVLTSKALSCSDGSGDSRNADVQLCTERLLDS